MFFNVAVYTYKDNQLTCEGDLKDFIKILICTHPEKTIDIYNLTSFEVAGFISLAILNNYNMPRIYVDKPHKPSLYQFYRLLEHLRTNRSHGRHTDYICFSMD